MSASNDIGTVVLGQQRHGELAGGNGAAGGSASQLRQMRAEQGVNVSESERAVSLAAGAIIGLVGLSRFSLPGMIAAAVGAGMVYRGATGHCALYKALDVDTAADDPDSAGIHLEQAFLINRSPQDLYGFWRNFENLPQIMTHLDSVRVLDERRSHWVAKAQGTNVKLEWDAEITQDEPNQLIAWRSLPGAGVDNAGQIRFAPAMGDRGTEVHVFMNYMPPGGRVGHWVARLMGQNPTRVIREDLRNFKRLMETGEIPTIIGQSSGTCTGQGRRYTESEWTPLFT